MKLDKTKALIGALFVVVLIGLILLVGRQVFSYSGLAFDVLTYVLSIVALALAVLSVVNSLRQNRILGRMVREVHSSIAELKEVAESTDEMEREMREEFRMNKVITDVLSEYGIGDDPKVRHAIAKRVTHRLKKTSPKA